MLKLVSDIRCGFKQLYMTEKDYEYDLDYMFEPVASFPDSEDVGTAKDFYESCKVMTQPELEEALDAVGVLDIIRDIITEEYAHSYFRDICFQDKEHPFAPGFTNIYNLRLVYTDEAPAERKLLPNSIKAKDVMAILGISRQTLCNYVKKGMIETDSNYTGKQYRYSRESVLSLKSKMHS